jgi:hypothetical protein
LTAKLAPSQRLDAQKALVLPAMEFSMRMGVLKKGEWSEIDRHVKRGTLSLPQATSADYIYRPRNKYASVVESQRGGSRRVLWSLLGNMEHGTIKTTGY